MNPMLTGWNPRANLGMGMMQPQGGMQNAQPMQAAPPGMSMQPGMAQMIQSRLMGQGGPMMPGMSQPSMSGPYGDVLARLRAQMMQQGGMQGAQPMQPAPQGMSGAASMLTPQMMQQLAARALGR